MKSGKKQKHNMSDNRQSEESDNIEKNGTSRVINESEGQADSQDAQDAQEPQDAQSGKDGKAGQKS